MRTDRLPMHLFQSMAEDIHFAIRMMRRSLAFTAAAVFSLALGIGATIAIFSVMYALAFRPLPVAHAEQLVTVGQGHSYVEWRLFRERQDIFSRVAAYNRVDNTFEVGNPGEELEVAGLYASGDYFNTLGVAPILGRTLQASDDQPGATPGCVISFGLWRQLYDQSRDILGQSLHVNGHTVQVLGVLPRSFFGVDVGYRFEIFMTLETERVFKDYQEQYQRKTPSLDDPDAKLLNIIGRLKSGISISQSNAGLRVLAAELDQAL
jgi:putative ABC transport system permease protein